LVPSIREGPKVHYDIWLKPEVWPSSLTGCQTSAEG